MSLREPFHFRYMREIVGLFVIGSVAIGVGSLVLLGAGQRWFERSVPVKAVFAAEKTRVIHPGVPVRLAGENVGRVEDVRVDKAGKAHVTMIVRLTARRSLREDSTAILRVPIAGLVGDLAVELTPGGDAPPFPDDGELPGVTQGDLLAELEGVLGELGEDLPALIAQARELLEHVNGIVAQAEAARAGTHAAALMARGAALAGQVEEARVIPRLAGVAGELERLLAGVNSGGGTAGKLVSDPAFHDRMVRLLDDLHASQADLAKLLAAAARVSDDGAAISAELRKRSEDLPAMLDETQRLLLRTNQTLEAMQRHWLLRGAVEEPSPRPEPPAVIDRAAPEPAGAKP